jgi:tyrosine-protein phosphatase YwqE
MKPLSTEDFIERQEPHIQVILLRLVDILMSSHPKIKTKISFNTPFFKVKNDFCYFGKIHKKNGVELCFLRGVELSNEQGLLDAKGRRIISGLQIKDIEDLKLKEQSIREIIQEALILDDYHNKHPFSEVLKKKNS